MNLFNRLKKFASKAGKPAAATPDMPAPKEKPKSAKDAVKRKANTSTSKPARKMPDNKTSPRTKRTRPLPDPQDPQLEKDLLELLRTKAYRPANVPVLLKLLKLPPKMQPRLEQVLDALQHQGTILLTKGQRYIVSEEADLVPGVIQLTRQGRGFVQPEAPGLAEIAIPENATSTAMHGDRVLVRRDRAAEHRLSGQRADPAEDVLTGSVVRILERKRSRLVGTLQRGRQFLYVVPDDPRMPQNIFVPEPKDVGRPAHPGDKVVVEMMAWENRHTNPEGQIVEVLGAPDAEGVDMLSVLRQYDLPLSFPQPVLDEARAIADAWAVKVADPTEIDRRVDCRSHNVITIDPDDAKDFDDAICIQPDSRDLWKVWVHIADVSHYVTPGTELDQEAAKRGNSTYLVDRVIPMLPEALSNELCSLKPKVDRLTKCVEFLIDSQGNVRKTDFYPAIIHSKHRYTYQEALAVIEGEAVTDCDRVIKQAHVLAQRLRQLRFKNGSLDLDFPESKIRLDDHGKVLRIERTENDVSHQLIEEYMLLANEAVAANLMKINRTAIYRVHESPKETKLNDYRQLVLSHDLPCGNLAKREEVQRLLQKLSTLPIGAALKIGFLRSLMRARYAVEPLGHYGLAKEKYTHFTSPIRRYSDLVVHRVLFEARDRPAADLRKVADHLSTTERTSADAERDSRDVKMYAYLEAQIDAEKRELYDALVTDVRNFGFFIDVTALGMSGMVHLSSVEDDFFVFDPARGVLTGRQSKRIIKLGDRLKVEIHKVDRFKKQVDFRLEGSTADPSSRRPAQGGRSRQDAGERPSRRRSQPSGEVPRTRRSGGGKNVKIDKPRSSEPPPKKRAGSPSPRPKNKR